MTIVLLSIQGRRLTKRYLRRGALNRFDLQVVLEGITMHRVYDVLFKTCLRTMFRSWIAHRNLPRALYEAVQAIQRLAVDYPLLVQFPHFIDSPYEGVRTLAAISLSGWARTVLSLKKNHRLRKALRKELDRRGEYDRREEDLLLELLPSNTIAAWQEREWHDLAELRTRIAYLVEHDVSEQSPQEFRLDEPLQAAVQPRDDPTYEEVARKLEEEDLYTAYFRQAKLTPYEETVARLQLQDYSDQEIADTIDKSLNGIQQAWLSARKKLKQVMPS
jgi:hypothetical protein